MNERMTCSNELKGNSPLKWEINGYLLRNCNSETLTRIHGFAKQIRRTANDPHIPMGKHLITVPVANDERGTTLHHSAALYARESRRTSSGITVVYGFNRHPSEEQNVELLDAFYRAQQHFPQLDMRFVDLGEQPISNAAGEPITCFIPRVEKDLVASTLYSLTVQPEMDTDYLIHIHDLDTRRLSPGYFAETEKTHAAHRDNPLMPHAEHTIYPLKPRVSQAITYFDLESAFSTKVPIYEPAFTIPASLYCRADGITDNGKIGQIIDLIERTESELVLIDGAYFYTSGRRLGERFSTTTAPVWMEEFEYPGLAYRGRRLKRDLDDYRYGLSIQINQANLLHAHGKDIDNYVYELSATENSFEATRDQMWEWIKERLRIAQQKILKTNRTIQHYTGHTQPLPLDVYEHLLTEQLSEDEKSIWDTPEFLLIHNANLLGISALQRFYGVDLTLEALGGIPSVEQFILEKVIPRVNDYTRNYLLYSNYRPYIVGAFDTRR